MLNSLGLSLIDHYWFKPIFSDLTWNVVNFYENPFKFNLSNTFGKWDNGVYGNTNIMTPDATLGGNKDKKYIVLDNKIYIWKRDYYYNYILATLINRLQGKYDYIDYRRRKDGIISELFTSESFEFVSIQQLCSQYGSVSEYLSSFGLDYQEYSDYVRLLDYVLGNNSRGSHIGVLYRENTPMMEIDIKDRRLLHYKSLG